MKKTIALLLALCMMLGMVACGGGAGSAAAEASTPAATVVDTTEQETDVVVNAGETEDTTEAGQPVDRDYAYGDLVIGTTEFCGGFDRTGTHGESALIAVQQVWDSLFIINSDTLEVEPLMVKEYEWVDNTSLRIVLHEGITSESGEPITAEDVIYSAERFIKENSRIGTYYVAYDFDRMWAELDDPDSLEFTWYYKYEYGPGLSYLTFPVYPKDWAETTGAEDGVWWDAPDATGPYVCTENVDGSHVSFKLRESYYGDTTGFPTTATIKYYTEQTALYTDYSTGAIDAAFGLASGDVENLQNGQLPNTAYKIAAKNDVYAMTLCHYTEFFQDENVRLAIAHAIDAEGVTAAAFGVLGKPATSTLPAGVNYYKNVGTYEYNPELAKEYLAKSKWPDGFTMGTVVCTNDAPTVAIATAVQGYLQAIGIEMSFEAYGIPVAVGEYYVPGVSELSFKNCMEGSPSLDPDQIYNTIGYDTTNKAACVSPDANDEFNTHLTSSLGSIDPEKRQADYDFVQQYLKDTAIQIPLVEAYYGYCYRSDYITSFNVTSPNTPHLRYCYFVDEATYNGQ